MVCVQTSPYGVHNMLTDVDFGDAKYDFGHQIGK